MKITFCNNSFAHLFSKNDNIHYSIKRIYVSHHLHKLSHLNLLSVYLTAHFYRFLIGAFFCQKFPLYHFSLYIIVLFIIGSLNIYAFSGFTTTFRNETPCAIHLLTIHKLTAWIHWLGNKCFNSILQYVFLSAVIKHRR